MKANELSTIDSYSKLQDWLDDYCSSRQYECWHKYGPADYEKYRSEPVKILLINSESWGYAGCGAVPPDEYLKWIKDRWNTPRYGALLVALIRDYISQIGAGRKDPPYDHDRMQNWYQDDNILIESMRPTIYMNTRITSNDTGESKEDQEGVMADSAEFLSYRKRFVEILKPRIIICAGDSAKQLMLSDGGVFPEIAIPGPIFNSNEMVFMITQHLSRPNLFGGYCGLHEIALNCASVFCSFNQSTRS